MRLLCRLFGHREKLTVSHGNASELMCSHCDRRQVYVDGIPLPPDESEAKSREMWRYAEGVMWLLDNVEPTYSAGRGDEWAGQ